MMKAVIPAAGIGLRYGLYTCIGDKEASAVGPYPAIFHGVRELYQSGVTGVMIVTTSDKISLARLLDPDRYRRRLDAKGLDEETRKLYEEVLTVIDAMKPNYRDQHEARGPANTVWEARDYVDDQNCFCVLLPDDVCLYRRVPPVKQLWRVAKRHAAVVGLQKLKTYSGWHSIVKKFSFAEPYNGRLFQIEKIEREDGLRDNLVYTRVETNSFELMEYSADSDYLPGPMETVGRYILRRSFLDLTGEWLHNKKNTGECMMTTMLDEMIAKKARIFGLLIDGDRYDTGISEEHTEARLVYEKIYRR